MGAHSELPAELLAAAHSRNLTRSNTRPGTPERRAVDRITYLRRRAKYPQQSARKATGHGRSAATVTGHFAGQLRESRVQTSYADARRVGKYDSLLERLLDGVLTDAQFDKRAKRWVPVRVLGGELPPGQYRFADAKTARMQFQSMMDEEREYVFDVEGS